MVPVGFEVPRRHVSGEFKLAARERLQSTMLGLEGLTWVCVKQGQDQGPCPTWRRLERGEGAKKEENAARWGQRLGHWNWRPCRRASDLKSGAKVRFERTWTHWEKFSHNRAQRRDVASGFWIITWDGWARREGAWSTTSLSRQEGSALEQRDPSPLAAADEAGGGMWIGVWEERVRDPCPRAPVFPGCDVVIEAGDCEV